MALPNRVREYRKRRKMTLRELSRQVGIDYGQLSKIETNAAGTSDERKLRLARFFGVGVGELFFAQPVENDSTNDATMEVA